MSKCWHLPPRVQAKLDAFAIAAQNGPLTDVWAKSKELLLGLKVLLKEYCRLHLGSVSS